VFIDNDGDAKADAVLIKSYTTGLIESVSVNMNKIFLRNTGAVEFDFNNEANRIIKDGKEIEAQDLNSFDVVSVMESGDNDIITVYVSSYKPIEGAIEKYADEYITIDGNEYKLSDRINLGGVVYSRESLRENLKLIPSATVYLNFKQEIAGIFSNNVKEQYGYLIKASYDDIEEKVYLKIFNQGGKVSRYSSNDKIKVDRKKVTAKEAYEKLLNGTAVQQQVIRFSTNKENVQCQRQVKRYINR
jgi:hypothetical protein